MYEKILIGCILVGSRIYIVDSRWVHSDGSRIHVVDSCIGDVESICLHGVDWISSTRSQKRSPMFDSDDSMCILMPSCHAILSSNLDGNGVGSSIWRKSICIWIKISSLQLNQDWKNLELKRNSVFEPCWNIRSFDRRYGIDDYGSCQRWRKFPNLLWTYNRCQSSFFLFKCIIWSWMFNRWNLVDLICFWHNLLTK